MPAQALRRLQPSSNKQNKVPVSGLSLGYLVGMQDHPGGYHADSKVSENVLGAELWNAAQVCLYPNVFTALRCMWFQHC